MYFINWPHTRTCARGYSQVDHLNVFYEEMNSVIHYQRTFACTCMKYHFTGMNTEVNEY